VVDARERAVRGHVELAPGGHRRVGHRRTGGIDHRASQHQGSGEDQRGFRRWRVDDFD
jgi:hypothetical protein